ncbi:MAG: sensor histidine kinase, partial [Anaerolineales bacterium]
AALGVRGDYPPEFDAVLKSINARLRNLVRNLRPLALDLGLRPALDELADEVRRNGNGVSPRLELGPSDARYPPQVEQHVFRIAQQAVRNTLRHARAKTVRLRGRLEPDEIDLTVEDDGQGFELGESPDLAELLAQGHYGLVGMLERAEIIGARVNMHSAPGQGTRVRVTWKRDKPRQRRLDLSESTPSSQTLRG